MIKINEPAIEFTLQDEKGNLHSLSSFRGKKVVLYFYPKDNTSGCTQQGIGFNELLEEFEKENAIVIGISKDSITSHAKFKEKYGFRFLLLSDPECKVIEEYGVYQEKSLYGRKFMGVVRSTFVIDEEGIIVSIQEKVKAKENPQCTLDLIRKL